MLWGNWIYLYYVLTPLNSAYVYCPTTRIFSALSECVFYLRLCFRCPFLHRTAGDTERRYHLRYYKTGSCIHETDSKGHCSKNGSHCAFAHGSHDLRSPVYDIRCRKNLLVTCETPTLVLICGYGSVFVLLLFSVFFFVGFF